jgi:hypothetical protein
MEEQNITPQPQQPDYITMMQNEAKRHNEVYENEVATWKKEYDDLTAEKKNLYKADERLAKVKRNEAALKTLIGAFGSLADTFAVARGGTAPLRDYRGDIYQTRQQADAIDQSEKAKETAAYQKYLDMLSKHMDRRPKWTKNDAAMRLALLYANKDEKAAERTFRENLQKNQQNFAAGEKQKDRDAAAKRTKANIDARNNKPTKERNPYTDVSTDIGEGIKSYNLTSSEQSTLYTAIKEHVGYKKNGQHNDKDIELIIQSMKNGYRADKKTLDNIIAKYINNDQHPELKKILRDMVRKFRATQTLNATETSTTDPQGNKLEEVIE